MPSEIEFYGDIVLFDVHVVFECNRQDVLSAVLAAYAFEDHTSLLDSAPSVYIVIRSTPAGDAARADHARVEGTHLDIMRSGISLHADGVTGRGRCEFPLGAANGEVLLDAINTIVLFLVAHAGRIPLHASAIMLDDTAIVFAGRSGSGKSTLALAASRAGLPVLSDDTIFVQTVPSFRIWSVARAIHVFEKDAPNGVEAGMRFRSGRWKKALAIAAPKRTAKCAILCVLRRGDEIGLEPLAQTQAVAEVVTDPEPGYEFYGERSTAAARALAESGAWRLTLSADPAEAIDLVRRIFAGITATRADGSPV
jgi:hypothetical protein